MVEQPWFELKECVISCLFGRRQLAAQAEDVQLVGASDGQYYFNVFWLALSTAPGCWGPVAGKIRSRTTVYNTLPTRVISQAFCQPPAFLRPPAANCRGCVPTKPASLLWIVDRDGASTIRMAMLSVTMCWFSLPMCVAQSATREMIYMVAGRRRIAVTALEHHRPLRPRRAISGVRWKPCWPSRRCRVYR